MLDFVDLADLVDKLLPFRPSFLMEPKRDRLWVGSGSTIQGEFEGMAGSYEVMSIE